LGARLALRLRRAGDAPSRVVARERGRADRGGARVRWHAAAVDRHVLAAARGADIIGAREAVVAAAHAERLRERGARGQRGERHGGGGERQRQRRSGQRHDDGGGGEGEGERGRRDAAEGGRRERGQCHRGGGEGERKRRGGGGRRGHRERDRGGRQRQGDAGNRDDGERVDFRPRPRGAGQ